MTYTMLYNDSAKLQMRLLEIGGVHFTHEFHHDHEQGCSGEIETVQYVTIKTGEDA